MSEAKVSNFAEYARIHQKIEVGARIMAVAQHRIGRIELTTRGLGRKQKVLGVIRGNRERLTAWVRDRARSGAEKRIARSMYRQWQIQEGSLREHIGIIQRHIDRPELLGSGKDEKGGEESEKS